MPKMSLLKTYFKVKIFQIKEQSYVFYKFYKKGKFFLIDLALFISYFLINPYRISKNFLKTRGEENIYQYGETPLSTLYEIAQICKIRSSDRVVDLGCGRGRGCFFLSCIIGCRIVGIEYIPAFCKIANGICRIFNLKKVNFFSGDYLTMDFSKVDVIYLYGSMLENKEITKLIFKLKSLPKGAKVITISYGLNEYSKDYLLIEKFSVKFPWGKSHGYLQIKR